MGWEFMANEKEYHGWTEVCCLCGRHVISWNNPDPLMDDTENCCEECNLLVRAARMKIFYKAEGERDAYEQMLRSLHYEELKKELL